MSRPSRRTRDRRALPGGLVVYRPHVALLGMMGAGKTTVGRLLAARLGLAFVDTDLRIEERTGLTVAEIFRRRGEGAFRKLEGAALESLASEAPSVIAVGGGLVTVAANCARLRAIARCVFLDADAATLAGRVGPAAGRTRPLLLRGGTDISGQVGLLLEARRPVYEAASDLEILTTGLTPEQTASLAARCLEALP